MDMHDQGGKCRSLVCDGSGVIIAEIVYRCMICYNVVDSLPEAKRHYQQDHMSNSDIVDPDEELDEETDLSLEPLAHHNHHPTGHPAGNFNGRSNGGPLVRNPPPAHSNGRSTHHPFVPSVSLYEDNQPLPLKFSACSPPGFKPEPNVPHPAMSGGAFTASTGRSAVVGANATGNSNGTTPVGTNSKSGFITCAVCNITRWYSCVQRRYGQYTCVTCYRYFRTFLIKPKKYSCPNLGKCPLNVRTRCRACWIRGCIEAFTVDPKRQAVIDANLPLKKMPSTPTKGSIVPFVPPSDALDDANSPATSPGVGVTTINGTTTNGSANGAANGRHSYPDFGEEEEAEEPVDDDYSHIDSSAYDNKIGASHDSSTYGSPSMLEPEVSLTEADANSDDAVLDTDHMQEETASDNNNNRTLPALALVSKMMPKSNPPQRQPPPQQLLPKQHQHQQVMQSLHQQVSRQSENKPVTQKKVWSCGKCDTCIAEDCGQCIYCLDRPKFGGKFVKKQRCLRRRCLMKAKLKAQQKTAATLLQK